MKKTFVLQLIFAILVQLAFSFCLWEFNPGLWKQEIRFLALYFYVAFSWVPMVVNS